MKHAFYDVRFYLILVEADSGNVKEVPVHEVNDLSMILKVIYLKWGRDATLRKARGEFKVVC